jgi:hypothetical protein
MQQVVVQAGSYITLHIPSPRVPQLRSLLEQVEQQLHLVLELMVAIQRLDLSSRLAVERDREARQVCQVLLEVLVEERTHITLLAQ